MTEGIYDITTRTTITNNDDLGALMASEIEQDLTNN
jgi:hypothetical protein